MRKVKTRLPNSGMVDFIVVSELVDLAVLDPFGVSSTFAGVMWFEAPA